MLRYLNIKPMDRDIKKMCHLVQIGDQAVACVFPCSAFSSTFRAYEYDEHRARNTLSVPNCKKKKGTVHIHITNSRPSSSFISIPRNQMLNSVHVRAMQCGE